MRRRCSLATTAILFHFTSCSALPPDASQLIRCTIFYVSMWNPSSRIWTFARVYIKTWKWNPLMCSSYPELLPCCTWKLGSAQCATVSHLSSCSFLAPADAECRPSCGLHFSLGILQPHKMLCPFGLTSVRSCFKTVGPVSYLSP